MRLDLREIIEVPGGCVPFDYEMGTDGLDFPSVSAYLSAPRVSGRVYNEAGVLRLEGQVTAGLRCVCDRCGEEFDSVKVTELTAAIVEDDPDGNPDFYLLDGDEVDLDEIASTGFVLDMETKFLCREDCKGLCPGCGQNLNRGNCTCGKRLDPRFAVLEQLLDK